MITNAGQHLESPGFCKKGRRARATLAQSYLRFPGLACIRRSV